MKALLILLALISVANAKENCSTTNTEDTVQETVLISTDVPSHLKGATIIVRLADGKTTEVPAELFKVVPRKQQRIVTKVANKELTVCKETLDNKNRVSLLGGYGPRDGLSKNVSANATDISSRTGVVGGAQYQRSITDRISIGVQGQTNKTGSLLMGIDF